MKQSYQVVDLSIGGNVIDVTATAKDDGGLTIYDLSYGPAADAFYGEGRDVEVWLEIPPDSARKLSLHLLGTSAENAADDVAQLLAATYENDNLARSKIQTILDENDIRYKKMMWT